MRSGAEDGTMPRDRAAGDLFSGFTRQVKTRVGFSKQT